MKDQNSILRSNASVIMQGGVGSHGREQEGSCVLERDLFRLRHCGEAIRAGVSRAVSIPMCSWFTTMSSDSAEL
jgi:hypothetical protein